MRNRKFKDIIMQIRDFKMVKIKKKAKFNLNSRVDISETTKARASKFCVVPYLELSKLSKVWCLNYKRCTNDQS